MNSRFSSCAAVVLFSALLLIVPKASSQDALRGKALYQNTNGAPQSCATTGNCHGPDPTRDQNGILKGANNPTAIHNAIVTKVPTMLFLAAYVSSRDEQDLAAYLANPRVSAAPGISVAPASLTFAATFVGSTSAVASISVSNPGTANLVLSSVALGGANAAEFRIEPTSTCTASATLVPGALCRVDLSFRPTSTGTKSATLTIAHNAATGSSQASLSGTASPPPAPAIAVSPGAITFPSTTAGGSSAVYAVTATNTGTATLAFSAIATSGANGADFRIEPTSTCSVSTGLAPGASCRIDLKFTPTVIGPLTASLVLAHNASSGSTSVALNGMSTAAPTPTIALSASSLAFGAQEVGTVSAQQTITLTNVGNAALTITALTAGGTHSTDFVRSGTCQAGMALAATGGNCTLAFAFAPTAAGARTGNLTIQSNNSGGDVTVSLAGNATTNVPSPAINPATLTFGTQQIGTSSAPQQVTVENTGGGGLAINAVAVSGPHFTQAGNCLGANLTAGQSCTLNVVFAPSASGSLTSTLSVTHGASATPLTVALAGTATMLPVPVIQAAPNAVAFPGVTVVGQPSAVQRVSIGSAGPGSVTLSTIATNSAEFSIVEGVTGSCAPALVVAQGASCSIDVRFSPAAPGARTGALAIASNGTPSLLSVALSGDATGVAAPGISSDRISLDFGTVTVATQSPPQQLRLTNTGSTNLDVSAVSVGAPFALAAGGTCANSPFSLTPGQSCVLQMQFAPSVPGPQSGMLGLASNAGSLSVALAGEGRVDPVTSPSTSVGASGAPVNRGGGGALDVRALLLTLLLTLLIGACGRRIPEGTAHRVPDPFITPHPLR